MTPYWQEARGEKWRAHMERMEASLAPVDEPLLAALALDRPLRIADVGCGGGATALAILRRAPAGSVVDGYDITPKLIEAARARTPPDAAGRIGFHVADMATTPPPGALYDRLVSRFGVMFFEDAPGAFANLRRWLAPGGRFAFAVWGRPADNPWMTNARDAVASVVEVPAMEPDAPGPFRYGDVATLLAVLRRAGFADVAAHDWRGALAIGGGPAAEAASFALAAFSTFAELLDAAGESARESARRTLTARFAPYERDGIVRLDAHVHIVTGTTTP